MPYISTESYRNLVYGNPSPLNYRTPGFPSTYVQNNTTMDFKNLVDIATAETTIAAKTAIAADITEAAIQNSPYGYLPALSCSSNINCPGEQSCESGRCLPKIITKPTTTNINGTILAYTESFNTTTYPQSQSNQPRYLVENFRTCGTAAEGKLGEVEKKKTYNQYNGKY